MGHQVFWNMRLQTRSLGCVHLEKMKWGRNGRKIMNKVYGEIKDVGENSKPIYGSKIFFVKKIVGKMRKENGAFLSKLVSWSPTLNC